MHGCKGLTLFIGGVLFGSAGIKLLSSRDAKGGFLRISALSFSPCS